MLEFIYKNGTTVLVKNSPKIYIFCLYYEIGIPTLTDISIAFFFKICIMYG